LTASLDFKRSASRSDHKSEELRAKYWGGVDRKEKKKERKRKREKGRNKGKREERKIEKVKEKHKIKGKKIENGICCS
jgi:hypothetical protein